MDYADNRDKFRDMIKDLDRPFAVNFYIVRKSKHKWDWTNAIDGIQDLMVKHEWIEDDNSSIMYPSPVGWHYDKECPGAFIWA